MSDLVLPGIGSADLVATFSVDPGMILNGKSGNEEPSSFDSFLDEEVEAAKELPELIAPAETVDFRTAVPWLLCRPSLLLEIAATVPAASESEDVPATIAKMEVGPRLFGRKAPSLAEPGPALDSVAALPRAITLEVAVPEAFTSLSGNVGAVPQAIDRKAPAGRLPLETWITPPEMIAPAPPAIDREMAARSPTIKAVSTELTAIVAPATLDFSGPVAPPQTFENATATHPFAPATIDRDGTVPLPIEAIAFTLPKLVDATPLAIDRIAPAPQTPEKTALTTPEMVAFAPRVIVREGTTPDASVPTREATLPTQPITIAIPPPAIGRGAPTPDAPHQTLAGVAAPPSDSQVLPITVTAPAPRFAERDARTADAPHRTLAGVAAPPSDSQVLPITVTAPAPRSAERDARPAGAPHQTLAGVATTPLEIPGDAPRTVVHGAVPLLPGEESAQTTTPIFTPAPPAISGKEPGPLRALASAVLPFLDPLAPAPPQAAGKLIVENHSPSTIEERVLGEPEISTRIQPRTTSNLAAPNALPPPIEGTALARSENSAPARPAVAVEQPAPHLQPQLLEKAVIATPENFAQVPSAVAAEKPAPTRPPLTAEEVASASAISQETVTRLAVPDAKPAPALPSQKEEPAKTAGKISVAVAELTVPAAPAENTASPANLDAYSVSEPVNLGGMPVAKTPMSMKNLSPDKFAETATSAVSSRFVPVEEVSRGEHREYQPAPHFATPEREQPLSEATIIRPVFETPAAAAHFAPRLATAEPAARPAELVSVFHTVEDMVERVRGQRSGPMELDLRLSDGDRLHVRLEMRAGELQTTFEAASPELRSALQQGWQEFSQRSLERGLRLGDANFTDTPARGESSLEQEAQRQPRREPAMPREAAQPAPRHPASPAQKTTPARGTHAGALSLWA